MGDVHHIPDPAEVEREASEWIARLEADDATDADRERFDAWKRANASNARIYDELRSTLEEFTAAGPMVRAVSFSQSMIEAGKPRVQRHWTLAAAAMVAVVVIAGGWIWAGRTPESFQTAIGEHATVTLPDGSVVELNSNTLTRVDYTRSSRTIRLERGEAYFKVAHDTTRPFWVVADGYWVRAVGTAFNVNIRPSGVRVIVSEGIVKVGSQAPERGARPGSSDEGASAATLTAGEQVDVRAHTVAVRRLQPADIARSTGWRTGTLYFENEPLGDVVAELNRYTTLKLVVRSPGIERVPVGGTFQASVRGAEALVEMLKDGLGLKVTRNEETVYIEAAPLPPT